MTGKCFLNLLFLSLFAGPLMLNAQISAPGSTDAGQTNYPVFPGNDNVYVFCTEEGGADVATLVASTALQGTKTFLWEKYDPQTREFVFHYAENTDLPSSVISGIPDGGYRVTITLGSNTEIHRAWVFNSRITASGEVPDSLSNCESFKLTGDFTVSEMTYYDPADGTPVEVFRDVKVQWKEGEVVIATVMNPQIFEVPPRNTDYTLRVYDRFGCEGLATVTYESIVTKASFEVDAQWNQWSGMHGEAPLEVTFNNTSENGDPNRFEWFFFRDLDEIKRESEDTGEPVDSFMVVAYDQSPVYTYENTGIYMVKLISKKVSEFHVCTDTVYLEDYIYVDTSFVQAPNVFTPNGDGVNDVFGIKFTSMQSMKITIVNRWGKTVHVWESNNIRGFDNTYEETVWDGRIGGRFASPGVYYYVVEGIGRDNEKRSANGYIHLFREKD